MALGPLLPVDAGPRVREVAYPGLKELAGFSGPWPAVSSLVAYRSVQPRARARPLPGDAEGETLFFEHQVGHGRVVVVPSTWAYHPVPVRLDLVLRYAFTKGMYSAWQYRFAQDLSYDCPEGHDPDPPAPTTLPQRVLRKGRGLYMLRTAFDIT